MPLVTVPVRPNGLPIAIDASPTSTAPSPPSSIGCSSDAGASTLITARSVDVSTADQRRLVLLAVPELDLDLAAVADDVLVRDDVALLVVDEARALGLRAAEPPKARSRWTSRHRDVDDALDRGACRCC